MTQAVKKIEFNVIDQEQSYLSNYDQDQNQESLKESLYVHKKDFIFTKVKNFLTWIKNNFNDRIGPYVINHKSIKWTLGMMLGNCYFLILIGVIVAQWTPDWLVIDNFFIWNNWISDLGGESFTPIPIIFDFACILGGIFCIFLNLTLNFVFRKNTLARFGILIGLIGNLGYLGVGVFSINRNFLGFMHELFSGVAFGGFVLWAFLLGWSIILYNTEIPKKIGYYGIIGPLTTMILFWIFKNPLCEWLLLFSIIVFVASITFFTLR